MTPKYEKQKCECCGQTKTYVLPIDRGTADIVRALAHAVRLKGVNAVHVQKEMEVPMKEANPIYGTVTSNQVNNLSRPRFHGLIAFVRGERGVYCLTRKGAAFLRGEAIHKWAIVSKVEKHQVGYWYAYGPGDSRNMVTIAELGLSPEYWEGLDGTG